MADWWATDLIQLICDETSFLEKFDEFPHEILSLIESMNTLKALFMEIKLIPDSPVTYKEGEPKDWVAMLDDRFLEAFYTGFVSGPHSYLLDELDLVIPIDKKRKRV